VLSARPPAFWLGLRLHRDRDQGAWHGPWAQRSSLFPLPGRPAGVHAARAAPLARDRHGTEAQCRDASPDPDYPFGWFYYYGFGPRSRS
jgi:hypothetical protein